MPALTLLADAGEDATIRTTAFVSELDEAEHWGDMPCILGLYGYLERMRFAVDPPAERFYFGPPPPLPHTEAMDGAPVRCLAMVVLALQAHRGVVPGVDKKPL